MTTGRSGVHPTAIVEDGARLGSDIRIGPYCTVGGHVELGDGVELVSHVVIAGHTRIGAGTRIFPFASIGHRPQDMKYAGETSYLEIGAGNTIREHVTMNIGTPMIASPPQAAEASKSPRPVTIAPRSFHSSRIRSALAREIRNFRSVLGTGNSTSPFEYHRKSRSTPWSGVAMNPSSDIVN